VADIKIDGDTLEAMLWRNRVRNLCQQQSQEPGGCGGPGKAGVTASWPITKCKGLLHGFDEWTSRICSLPGRKSRRMDTETGKEVTSLPSLRELTKRCTIAASNASLYRCDGSVDVYEGDRPNNYRLLGSADGPLGRTAKLVPELVATLGCAQHARTKAEVLVFGFTDRSSATAWHIGQSRAIDPGSGT